MKIKLGTRWEKVFEDRGVLEIYPEWRDLWWGLYIAKDAVYVCPIPCVVLRFSRGSRMGPLEYMRAEMHKIMTESPVYRPSGILNEEGIQWRSHE